MKAGPILGRLRLPRAGEWGFGPGAFTHCLGYTLNRGPDFIDLAKLGTFPYAFPRERGAETATVAQ